MQKQAFRLERADPEKMPVGSFRLQLPGNPNAINAALASGRFPGVLVPYPIADIYPAADPENDLLHRMLGNWLDDPQVEAQMAAANQALHEVEGEEDESWNATYARWRAAPSMRAFFPQVGDVYVDGGAIDNTPSNSAIDATREWVEIQRLSKSELVLDLYVVFLHPEPVVSSVEVQAPALYQVVQRTLEIQGAAKLSSDAVVVDTINTFGWRGELLGKTLLLVLDSYREALDGLDAEQRRTMLDQLRQAARAQKLRGYLGEDSEGILERMSEWAAEIVDERLPLYVNEIRVYPEKMPLSTLQFTERLGYRRDNAIDMLTMGCYNTLWAVRRHLEEQRNRLDDRERQVLALARKWIAVDEWPADAHRRDELRQAWPCQRTACAFYAQHCPHGARQRRPVSA
jgi:hypothetical protein